MAELFIHEFSASFLPEKLPAGWLETARARAHTTTDEHVGLATVRGKDRLVSAGIVLADDKGQPTIVFVSVSAIPPGDPPEFVKRSEATWSGVDAVRDFLIELLGQRAVATASTTFDVDGTLECSVVSQTPSEYVSPAVQRFAESAIVESVGYRFTGAPDGIISVSFDSGPSSTSVRAVARGTVDLIDDIPDGSMAERLAGTIKKHFFIGGSNVTD